MPPTCSRIPRPIRSALLAAAAITAVSAWPAAAGASAAPNLATLSGASTPFSVDTAPAPAAASDPATGALIPAAATRALSYAARLVVPVTVRRTPSTSAPAVTKLEPFGSWNGGPVVLQIAEVRTVGVERWLRVRLPIRPNGTTGWLQESSVEVQQLRYRVEIDRRAHLLTLLEDGRRIGSTRVVVGAPETPTPKGAFAVLEVVRQRKGAVIGPWALHLTAHSEVLEDYGGGPGRVALHGRSGALLDDPLGTSRSHGCIRMPNAFVSKLRRVATEGTPVTIR